MQTLWQLGLRLPPGYCDLLNAPVRGTNPLPPTLWQLGLPPPPRCCDLLNAPVRGTNPLPPTLRLQQQLGLPVPPKGAMQAAVAPINLLSL